MKYIHNICMIYKIIRTVSQPNQICQISYEMGLAALF